MVSHTVRGGVKTRKRMKNVYKRKNAKYLCPNCKKKSLTRMQYAVWKCNSCKSVYAGGAWSFNTAPGKESLRKLALIKKEDE